MTAEPSAFPVEALGCCRSTDVMHLECSVAVCWCLFLCLLSSCCCSLKMSQSIFLCKDSSFAQCYVLKLTLCVWYRCRSDRRQRKCSRANGVHSLQRILPGDPKRKIKQTLPLAFSFRNTTLCAALRLPWDIPKFLDGGEHISEICLVRVGCCISECRKLLGFLLFVTLLQRGGCCLLSFDWELKNLVCQWLWAFETVNRWALTMVCEWKWLRSVIALEQVNHWTKYPINTPNVHVQLQERLQVSELGHYFGKFFPAVRSVTSIFRDRCVLLT